MIKEELRLDYVQVFLIREIRSLVKRQEEVNSALHNTGFFKYCQGCRRIEECWEYHFRDAALMETFNSSGVFFCVNNSKLHDKDEPAQGESK